MMPRAEIKLAVRGFLAEQLMFRDGAAEGIEDDTSFLRAGLIDSTGVLELIMFIEQRFGIEVKDADMLPENMDSINNVANFVCRKQAGVGAPAAAGGATFAQG